MDEQKVEKKKIVKILQDSVIINNSSKMETILSFFDIKIRTSLLYRGSVDGFRAANFH
jgi:hypothetical protein